MKPDVALNPLRIRLFGPDAVVAHTERPTHFLEEFGLVRVGGI